MLNIRVKSVYAKRGPEDGYRVLVDDMLPASMNEGMAGVDLWMRGIGPSPEVMRLLEELPVTWDRFRNSYIAELETGKGHLVEILLELSHRDGVTLFFSTADPDMNVATALRDYLYYRDEGIAVAA